MLEKEIQKAYETMGPDEDARERMLRQIRTEVSSECRRKESKTMRSHKKGMLRAAAAVAAILLMTTVAYASGFLKLEHLGVGSSKIDAEADPQHQEREVDMISLGGYVGSPEYQACMEWKEFVEGYDTDGSILSAIGNSPTGFEEEYGEYLCYTQEMADRIDEICEKYQLSRLTGWQLTDAYEDMCRKAGVGDLLGSGSEQVRMEFQSGYVYADGSFHMEGNAILAGSPPCMTDYQLMRSMKGTFEASLLNVGDIDQYRQWTYTTKNGAEVLLANSSSKALIIAEQEQSFIVVNLLGNIAADSFEVSDEMLEELAEAIDFTAVP